MKVYKVILMVIDHDELGAEGIEEEIEAARFANHCMSPNVMSVESAEIGEWDDEHPLNQLDSQKQAFEDIFSRDDG